MGVAKRPKSHSGEQATRHWQPVGPVPTIAQRVAAALRDRMLGGAFRPGEFIRQEEVALGLGVSRMPVREALMVLANEGFVVRVPRRGFQIPDRSIRDLIELYPILTVLERAAGAASLPKLTAADRSALRRTCAELQRATAAMDAARALELNLDFHRLLASRCGNRRLIDLLETLGREILQLEFWSFANPDHRAIATREHDDILAAVEVGDFDRALQLMETNRLLARDAFIRQFKTEDETRPDQ